MGATVETLCIGIFALTSAVGMGMYVGRHVGSLFGKTASAAFQILYLVLMVAGGYVGFDAQIPGPMLSSVCTSCPPSRWGLWPWLPDRSAPPATTSR